MSKELYQELSKLRRYKRRIKRSYKQLQTAYNEQARIFQSYLNGEMKEAVSYAKEAAQTRRRKCALEAGLRNLLGIKDIETIKKRIITILNNETSEETILSEGTCKITEAKFIPDESTKSFSPPPAAA